MLEGWELREAGFRVYSTERLWSCFWGWLSSLYAAFDTTARVILAEHKSSDATSLLKSCFDSGSQGPVWCRGNRPSHPTSLALSLNISFLLAVFQLIGPLLFMAHAKQFPYCLCTDSLLTGTSVAWNLVLEMLILNDVGMHFAWLLAWTPLWRWVSGCWADCCRIIVGLSPLCS